MNAAGGTFVTEKVTITVSDDDALGIGDEVANDLGQTTTETGALPTITAVSDSKYNALIGKTINFHGEYGLDGTATAYEMYGVGIGGHSGPGAGYYSAAPHPDNPNYLETLYTAGGTTGGTGGGLQGRSVFETQPLFCFTSGTVIKTQIGERPIEELAAGDMVVTMDHGPQPIRWIGSSKRPAIGKFAPILIRKGALGNTRDLRVSPQHRMLLSGWHAEVLFGEREVLATAKSLVNDHSILSEEGGEVEYFHMLFDTLEIVYAEGAPSESFHPGPEGWKALDEPTRNEILELFPQLANGNFDSYGPSARASLKYKEGSLLSHSMISQTQH